MEVAHRGELFEAARLQRKRILRLPGADRFDFLHMDPSTVFDQAKFSGRIFLLVIGLQAEWLQERLAKPNVSQPGFFEIHTECQVIEFRSLPAIRFCYSSREVCDLESHRSQQGWSSVHSKIRRGVGRRLCSRSFLH